MTRAWLHEAANELAAECRGFDNDDLIFIWKTTERMRKILTEEFQRRDVVQPARWNQYLKPKPPKTARKATR